LKAATLLYDFGEEILMRRLLLSAVVMLGICGTTPSHADVLSLYKSIPDLTAKPKDYNLVSSINGMRVYNAFELDESSIVTEIRFEVFSRDFVKQPITVEIFTLSGVKPDIAAGPLYSQTFWFPAYSFTEVSHPGGFPTETIKVAPDGLTLSAGSYDITFFGPGLTLPDYRVSNEDPQSGYWVYQTSYTQNDGFHKNYALGFDLLGTAVAAPEPASAALFGMGLIILTTLHRRRAGHQSRG
jgi:hypothetical protein